MSAGCGFRKKTIVGMRRNGRDAPIPAVRGAIIEPLKSAPKRPFVACVNQLSLPCWTAWCRARLDWYPSGEGRLSSVGLMWRDCAVVQTPVFAPVQETVRWQVSRYWLVLRYVAGGASGRKRRLWGG